MATPASIPESVSLPDDLVKLKEALALMRGTPYPASMSTLRRWLDRYDIDRFTFGSSETVYVSYTDVLEAQRDAAQERPRP